jgi:hypothetical protein
MGYVEAGAIQNLRPTSHPRCIRAPSGRGNALQLRFSADGRLSRIQRVPMQSQRQPPDLRGFDLCGRSLRSPVTAGHVSTADARCDRRRRRPMPQIGHLLKSGRLAVGWKAVIGCQASESTLEALRATDAKTSGRFREIVCKPDSSQASLAIAATSLGRDGD